MQQPSLDSVLESLKRLSGARVLVLGDLMIDEYLMGDVERISPEAPVPVVLIEREQSMLGGAGNVARNIKSLGGNVVLLTACGDGRNRLRLDEMLEAGSIDVRILDLPGHPATTKTRVLARQQQMLRIDHEHSARLDAAQSASLLCLLERELRGDDVIIVSDYCKGCITPELMDGIRALKKSHTGITVLVDPKVPNYPLYNGVDLLTPNSQETSLGADGLPVTTKAEIIAAGKRIFEKLGCHSLLTTLGAQGMALFQGPDSVLHLHTQARKVFDVTGAGDTVIATLAVALAAGLDEPTACMVANQAAGLVVGEVGTAVTTQEALQTAFTNWGVPKIETWL